MPRREKYISPGAKLTKQDGTPRYTRANLPSKICVTCGRPYSWRKAWAKVWDEIKYCSGRCRREKKP